MYVCTYVHDLEQLLHSGMSNVKKGTYFSHLQQTVLRLLIDVGNASEDEDEGFDGFINFLIIINIIVVVGEPWGAG